MLCGGGCWLLLGVHWLIMVVCRVAVCCALSAVVYSLCIGCCLLVVVRWSVSVGRCMLVVVCSSVAAGPCCRWLFGG